MASHCSKLAVCLLNISEARNWCVVEKIAKAACSVDSSLHNADKTLKCSSTVLNIFADHEYNRSVLTIAAPTSNLKDCIINACKVAYKEIDLSKHRGGHPRLGAVDLVPIYPISPSVTLGQCGRIARTIGEHNTRTIPGTSVFFFGTADRPRERGLVERRKEVGWYKGKHGMSYDNVSFDIGVSPTARYGLTGVGASLYVMNCNVMIETDDILVGREITKKIRGSSLGGLPGVQAMAFKHESCIEIACNVESYISGTAEVSSGSKNTKWSLPRKV